MDLLPESRVLNSYGEAGNGYAAMQDIVAWLNSVLVDIHLPLEAAAEDIRACLLDGTVLCQILNQLYPGSLEMVDDDDYDNQSLNVERFLSAVHKMGFPGFDVLDLEQGYLNGVFECLLALRENLYVNANDGETTTNHTRKKWNLVDVEYLDEELVQKDGQQLTKNGLEKRRTLLDSIFQTALRYNEGTALNEPNNKFKEVFYAKNGALSDISAAKISDMMKWNSLDKAPTQLLFSIVDKVLDESFEGKNGDVHRRVACLMRKLVREIERRVSSQADRLRNHNNLIKSREVKYQSRVKVLQTLAVGTAEENEVVINQLRQIRSEKAKLEDKKKHDDQDVVHLRKEIDQRDAEIIALKQGMEAAKLSYERQSLELENQMKETKFDFERKVQELEYLLADTNKKMKENEENSEMKIQKLKKKESYYQSFMLSHFSMLQVLREDLHAVRSEVKRSQKRFPVEVQNLGTNLKGLVDAAESYHMVLDENRKLYNEVQDLKGNIRVYCRVRPFLSGQSVKQTSIEHIGENGELVVTNPSKQGKDTRRLFKFNKVFGQTVTQEEVFKDTQPLIRSVLDGYNVCIFAYGQTGSGKTYTMSGPDMSSQKDWGVNYRALHDLFQISQSRRTSIIYEVGVQMVEIYNEQVRDLLATDGPQKRLGIWSTSQPNGLAVPDATMHPVKSTSDVLELMNIGLMNRAVGATALNERSSRSHSILTVHVHGTDLKKNSVLRGSLHLVDLAGSERVDRSEATGDRLREAQHINKSLSALGDVIFALAHKSGHVPYRNSKLTQVLQSSLGGQAKTLMFVQLNPDPESYSETVSTLKFAERVSGVELGAARSNKEGRDVREFMEQITSLKETITKKDEELEQLRLVKTNGCNFQKRGISIARGETSPSPSPRRHSIGPASRPLIRTPSRARSATSDQESCSESGSQRSAEESRYRTGSFHPQIPAVGMMNSNTNNDDVELLGFGDDSEERLSDISDSGLSMGTETDGSMTSVVEYTLFPDTAAKPATAENSEKSAVLPSKLPKPPAKQVATAAAPDASSSQPSVTKSAPKVVSGMRRSSSTKVPAVSSSSSMKPKLRSSKRWQ